MSKVIRPTNMARAFVHAAIPHLQQHGPKSVWTALRVAENADREVGRVEEINEINISGTPPRDIDARLRRMGFEFESYSSGKPYNFGINHAGR